MCVCVCVCMYVCVCVCVSFAVMNISRKGRVLSFRRWGSAVSDRGQDKRMKNKNKKKMTIQLYEEHKLYTERLTSYVSSHRERST